MRSVATHRFKGVEKIASNKPLPKVSRQFAEAKEKGGVVIYLDGNRTIYDQCTMEDLIVSNGIVRGENVNGVD